jgi:hypothetical protein
MYIGPKAKIALAHGFLCHTGVCISFVKCKRAKTDKQVLVLTVDCCCYSDLHSMRCMPTVTVLSQIARPIGTSWHLNWIFGVHADCVSKVVTRRKKSRLLKTVFGMLG